MAILEAFRHRFIADGGAVVLETSTVPTTGPSFRDVIGRLRTARPDLVFLMIPAEVQVRVIDAIQDGDLLDEPRVATDHALGEWEAYQNLQVDSTGLIYATPHWLAWDLPKGFEQRVWDRFGDGTGSSGEFGPTYDATNLILDAIEHSATVGDDHRLVIEPTLLRNALLELGPRAGVIAEYDCDEHGDCVRRFPMGILEVHPADAPMPKVLVTLDGDAKITSP